MLFFSRQHSIQDDLLVFTNEMGPLLALKAPLDRCLHSVAQELAPGVVRRFLESASFRVASGVPFSKVLAENPDIFPEIYVRSVAAGEVSGDLAKSFHFLSRHLENKVVLDRKIRNLSIYPVMVLLISGFVFWLLIAQIVPVFEKVIEGVGETQKNDVPFSMELLITISQVLNFIPNWLSLMIGIVLSLWVLYSLFILRNSWLHRLVGKLPWFRRIHEESALAVLTGVLGTALRSGIPLDQALFLARDTLEDPKLRSALSEVARGVQGGERASVLMEHTGLFPATFTWLVSLSEEEGSVSDEMMTLSERYFRQATDSLSVLEMVTRPALLIFLCLIVGSVVVVMFSALVRLPGLIPLGGFR